MKKKYFYALFALSLISGICASIFRIAQFNSEKGIFESGAPSTYILIALFALSVIVACVAAFFTKKNEDTSSDKPCIITPISLWVSGFFILAYAGVSCLSLRDVADINLLFSFRQPDQLANLVLVLFSIYCAASLFVIGKNRMEERNSTMYSIFAAVPVFWACFMLILTFREKISDPIINNYVFHIFSYISILFVAYSLAAHLLGKQKRKIAVLSAFIGMFFMLTEVITSISLLDFANFNILDIQDIIPQIAFIALIPGTLYEIVRK